MFEQAEQTTCLWIQKGFLQVAKQAKLQSPKSIHPRLPKKQRRKSPSSGEFRTGSLLQDSQKIELHLSIHQFQKGSEPVLE